MIQMNDITPILAVMIGLAVGIDYSLFIVNRQRRLILDENLSAREAASRAVGTAGSAVFFAGLTVIIALCGMLVIGIGFLSTMALVAAVSVLITVLLALTLLPALLGLVGEKICTTKARNKNAAAANKASHGFSRRWANATVKYRWVIIILVVLVLGTAAIPVTKWSLAFRPGPRLIWIHQHAKAMTSSPKASGKASTDRCCWLPSRRKSPTKFRWKPWVS